MKRMTKIWFAACAALLLNGCGISQDDTEGVLDKAVSLSEVAAAAEQSYPTDAANPIEIAEDQVDTPGKKIIRDGQMRIRVDDLAATKRLVDSLVRNMNGYFASESFKEYSYTKSYQLQIRIPAANFDRFIAALESGGGKVLSKDLEARDVTEKFTDIELRLANKRNSLKRYQALVAQANTVSYILEVEEKIRRLEEEIESAEGRLRLMGNQIAYSTLDLNISMETEYKFTPDPQTKFSERIKKALSEGWDGVVGFIVVIFYLWPLVIVGGTVLFLVLRARKKKKTII